MPRNGSGVYGPPAGTAGVPNQVIESAKYNAFVNDVAEALTKSTNVDGTAPYQANQNMGGNKLTNLAAGAAASDSLTLGQAQSAIIAHATAVAGTADAITTTFSPAFGAWTAKMRFRFTAGGANTTINPTVNVDSLGVKTIKKLNGQALAIGDIAGAGHVCDCVYDGTDVILLNFAPAAVDRQQNFTAKQIFSGPVITTVTTLTDAPTIVWDMAATGNDVKVILTASRNLGLPTNIQTGMKGLLIVEQNATGGWVLTPNAVFDLSGSQTALDLDKAANAQTIYEYEVVLDSAAAQKIRLRRIYATNWDSIGHFVEYDLGLYTGPGVILDTTHNLGRYPSHATVLAQCVTAEFGYSVGDRIFVPEGPLDTDTGGGSGNGNNWGQALVMSATKVRVVMGFLMARDQNTFYMGGLTASRWRLFLRVFV